MIEEQEESVVSRGSIDSVKSKHSNQDCVEVHHTLHEKLTHYIGTLQQAPKYIQDHYIKVGYRVNFTRKRQVLKSLFMWHNEVVNIWTHLLGAVFVISLIFYIHYTPGEQVHAHAESQSNHTKKDEISRWPLYMFLLSAAICMGGSAVFHAFYCMSAEVNKILLRIDYAGICFLISGSTYAPYYYGFYCHSFYGAIYTGLNVLLCGTVFVVSMFDFIHTLEYRPLKGRMYATLGIVSGLGGLHLMVGSDDILQGYSFSSQVPWYLLMGVAYLGGLAIFQTRWPEAQVPYKFDNCGQSHQLWHICVVIAVFLTYIASLNAYSQRMETPCK